MIYYLISYSFDKKTKPVGLIYVLGKEVAGLTRNSFHPQKCTKVSFKRWLDFNIPTGFIPKKTI